MMTNDSYNGLEPNHFILTKLCFEDPDSNYSHILSYSELEFQYANIRWTPFNPQPSRKMLGFHNLKGSHSYIEQAILLNTLQCKIYLAHNKEIYSLICQYQL